MATHMCVFSIRLFPRCQHIPVCRTTTNLNCSIFSFALGRCVSRFSASPRDLKIVRQHQKHAKKLKKSRDRRLRNSNPCARDLTLSRQVKNSVDIEFSDFAPARPISGGAFLSESNTVTGCRMAPLPEKRGRRLRNTQGSIG